MTDMHPDLARVIISTEEIKARVAGLAWEIEADYADVERIILVGILKGGIYLSRGFGP